jgi:DNA-binding IclR family transcriptional regulator
MDLGYFIRNPPTYVKRFPDSGTARIRPFSRMSKSSTAMSSTLRCLRLLELLGEEPFEMTLTDIGLRLAVPKASAHRLCATLLEAKLIEQDPRTRRYILSSRALWIGSGYLRHSAVYRASFFPMQELAQRAHGTAQLGVLDDDRVLFIHSVGYSGVSHAFADVGLRRPLHATASGKIFFAAMPQAEMERIMSLGCEKYTGKTITSLARMQQEIAQVRRKRYARNVAELLPGYWILAAGIVGRDGRTAAAISVTLPLEDFRPARETELASLVREAGRKASIQLGHLGGGTMGA